MKLKDYSEINSDMIIFYADDDYDDLETFRDVVEDISTAKLFMHNHAEDMLHALENPPPSPHLVFIDLNMPGMSGFELLKEMRRQEHTKFLPVVVVSTSNDEQTIAKTYELGANYYITKPNDYNTLKRSIGHAMAIDWNSFKPDPREFVYRNN